MRPSHRTYAGGGASRLVLLCRACGNTVTTAPRSDTERLSRRGAGRSRRHQPVDEGPPSNPVLDDDVARRLLEGMDG